MRQILVAGRGKIGRMIARLLVDTGDYRVRVGDVDASRSRGSKQHVGVDTVVLDVDESGRSSTRRMRGCDTVISALSFHYNVGVAEAAPRAGSATST